MATFGLWFLVVVVSVCGSTSPPTTTTPSPQTQTSTPSPTPTLTTTSRTTATALPTTARTTSGFTIPTYGIVLTSAYYYYSDNLITFLPTLPENFTSSGGFTLPYAGRESMKLTSCALDYRDKILFVYDRAVKTILSVNVLERILAASTFEFSSFHSGAGFLDTRIVYDWVSKNLYWADNGMNHLAMAPAKANDNGFYKVILRQMLSKPLGLTLDPESGYIFVVNYGSKNILRCSLTGKNAKIIVQTGLNEPYDIAADLVEKNIYWIDDADIWGSDYNGDSKRLVHRNFTNSFVGLDVFRGLLMTTEFFYGQLFIINKTSGETLAESATSDEYWDVCMYHEETQPITFNASACDRMDCKDICVMKPPTYSAICLCREGFELDSNGRTCTEAAGEHHRALVITDGTQICLIDIRILIAFDTTYLDSKDCFYTRRTTSDTGNPSEAEQPIRVLTLRMDTRTVIFATETEIYQVSMDIQNPTPDLVVSVEGVIGGISYDWLEKNVYYTNVDKNTVNAVSLETTYSIVVSNHTVGPTEIVVLPHYQKVIWISSFNSTSGAINSANLDGGDEEVIAFTNGPATNLVHDPIDNWLLYHEAGASYNYVRAINITGGVMRNVDYLFGETTAYAVYKNYYVLATRSWEETEVEVGQRNVGSILSTGTIAGLDAIVSMAVQDTSLQHPYADPCSLLNGGCEDICIPNGASRECFCATGSSLAADGLSCVSYPETDNFLVVADISSDTIFQIPLNESKSIQNVPHASVGLIRSVMYNYLTDKLFYTGYGMWESNLNGTEARTVLESYSSAIGYTFPNRMTLDSSTGNTFYTSPYVGIGVVTPNGMHTALNLDYFDTNPRDIAVDEERGLLFWIDKSYYLSSSTGVFRANMDGSNMTRIVSDSDINLPAGLALDTDGQILYITDGAADVIYSCTYDGKNYEEIHEEKGSSPEDIVFSEGYLYFSAWNYNYITRLNTKDINDKKKLFQNAPLGRLNGMDLYISRTVKIATTECSTNNGGCSHFCFPTPTGHTCGCEDNHRLYPDGRTCSNVPTCPKNLTDVLFPRDCFAAAGITCTVQCREGYKLKTGVNATLTCLPGTGSGGVWNEMEPCEEITCPEQIPNGEMASHCRLFVGAVCDAILCQSGHELTPGTTEVTCAQDGTWTPEPLCEEKCPDGIVRGTLIQCDRKTGQTCVFECDDNYRPVNNINRLRCVANSTWDRDPSTVCEEIRCTTNIPNGNLSLSCGTTIGSKCYDINCSPGHEPPAGVTYITCGPDGVWSTRAESLCEEKCPVGVSNGRLVNCGRNTGTKCTFECDRTFRARDGDNTVTCLSGSQWQRDISSVCEEILYPDVIPHGSVSSGCDRTVNSACTRFTCETGYELGQGGATLTCDVSGSWAGSVNVSDICEEKCPDAIANGRLESCGRMPGDKCTFSCDITHKPRGGNSRIVCQSGSQWNRDADEVCEEILCPITISITGAGQAWIESNCSRRVGDRCLYSCDAGYVINVDVIHQTCQRSGQWSNTANPSGTPCVASVQTASSQTAEQRERVIVGVTVTIIVVLVICMTGLTFYICRLKGKYPLSKRSTYRMEHTENTEGISGFGNPQYANTDDVGARDGVEGVNSL